MKVRPFASVLIVLFLLAANASAQPQAASCQFQLLDFPGAQSTEASGINKAGVVVGSYFIQAPPRSGFVFHHGRFVSFAVPGSKATSLSGINNLGWIVGSFQDQTFNLHGFLLRDRQVIKIDFPGGLSTQATGINDFGIIVGSFSDGVTTHGFVKIGRSFIKLDFPGSTFSALTGINNRGAIVGVFASATEAGGFLFKDGRFTRINVPGEGPSTTPFAISPGGKIVGRFAEQSTLPHIQRGFIDRAGVFKSVIFGADHGTVLKGVNGEGAIVGQYHAKSPEDLEFRSFIATKCK